MKKGSMGELRIGRSHRWKTACAIALLCTAAVIASPAQIFTNLVNFNGTNGVYPYYMALVQGTDGNLYGTTFGGGANSGGTVFKVTPTGTLTTIYSFCAEGGCTDGYNPYAGLVLGTDGNFYGTTYAGGANDNGTVFQITAAGALTVLHSFSTNVDGAFPYSALIQATNGDFYGTTTEGGSNGTVFGTVFSITAQGTLTTLYNFPNGYTTAGLVQATNGDFYGTTFDGGTNHSGTVFRITEGGRLKTLYNFCSQTGCPDGANPLAGLIQATNGNLYGTTYQGGGGGGSGDGTVFSITPGGAFNTVLSFEGSGASLPYAGLVQGNNGVFYGTTENGGNGGNGTVFSITSEGTLTTLHTFSIAAGGYFPYGGLLQATNGTLYGTTVYGTTVENGPNDGTLFSMAVGLHAFVKTVPTSGEVGAAVTILGTDLTDATGVTFNGAAAAFTVVSGSEITATVPMGATTGKVKVTTPSRTLTSNVSFRVP